MAEPRGALEHMRPPQPWQVPALLPAIAGGTPGKAHPWVGLPAELLVEATAGRFSGPGVGVHICTPPLVCAFDRRRAGLRLTRLPGLTARTTCRRLGVLAGETHHRENRFRLIPAEDADAVGIPSSLVVWSGYVWAVPAGTQEGQTWGKQ